MRSAKGSSPPSPLFYAPPRREEKGGRKGATAAAGGGIRFVGYYTQKCRRDQAGEKKVLHLGLFFLSPFYFLRISRFCVKNFPIRARWGGGEGDLMLPRSIESSECVVLGFSFLELVSESFLSLVGVRHSNEHFVLKGIWQGFSGSLHSCWKEHLVSRVNENGTQLSSSSTHCRPPRTHEQSHQAPHSRRNGEREGKGGTGPMLLARTEEEKPQEGRDEIFFSPTRFFWLVSLGSFAHTLLCVRRRRREDEGKEQRTLYTECCETAQKARCSFGWVAQFPRPE